jgi:predicted amidohydrolase YtcJ
MLITDALIDGPELLDVRIDGNTIVEISSALGPRTNEVTLDAGGGALLPGLHDHHIHLFATAAALESLDCGAPAVLTRDALGAVLARAHTRDGWLRGTGYHESVAGLLDRHTLDALRADVAVRIQHRSGQAWFLNSKAIELLNLTSCDDDGIERQGDGTPSGRVFRCDALIRERAPRNPPSLQRVGRALTECGVTGVTDATVSNGVAELAMFNAAVNSGDLPQRLFVMGGLDLASAGATDVRIAAVKIVLDERDLPSADALAELVARAHALGRSVAFHCVARSELVYALATLDEVGVAPGDRIEHAGVCPPECAQTIRRLGITVVTQPGFIHARGDSYLADVDAADRPWLYPCGSLASANIAVGGSTDAPYGPHDPWLAMQTAVDRRTASGKVLGENERVTPERALALFTTPGHTPGGRPRRVAVGEPADLCILDLPWSEMRDRLERRHVRATVRGGTLAWLRG